MKKALWLQWLTVGLTLVPQLSYACDLDEKVDPNEITQVNFNAFDSSFAYNQFQLHRTINGWTYNDKDQTIFFNQKGEPCLSVKGTDLNGCGEALQAQLQSHHMDRLIAVTGTNRGTGKSENIGLLVFDFKHNKIILHSNKCPDSNDRTSTCIDRDRNGLAWTGSTAKDQDGNVISTLDVQVQKPGGAVVGEAQLQKQEGFTNRCIGVVTDFDQYQRGKIFDINNLSNNQAYVITGSSAHATALTPAASGGGDIQGGGAANR